MDKEKKIFLVHEYETMDGFHHLHSWDGSTIQPHTINFEVWSVALEEAYKLAQLFGLDNFQVDHPDFPHKFMKVLRTIDIK